MSLFSLACLSNITAPVVILRKAAALVKEWTAYDQQDCIEMMFRTDNEISYVCIMCTKLKQTRMTLQVLDNSHSDAVCVTLHDKT